MAPMSGCYGYDLQAACSSKRESIPMRMHMHKTAADFFPAEVYFVVKVWSVIKHKK